MTRDPDFRQADEILGRIRETTSDIGAVLAELESTVEPDVEHWPADAKARYRAAKHEWTAAVHRMPECLERARQAFCDIAAEESDRGH
ncbi:WXG100 family type VII secretion target [Amycolatopsis jejuensis]|uniref:WXG100 family type VII secretion target n=1 Tax=Amycolatopsis jejuensis TaxID=330084 RepID=UPI000526549D|nr:hypothetical protein [Amycolatopsis jejuensis]